MSFIDKYNSIQTSLSVERFSLLDKLSLDMDKQYASLTKDDKRAYGNLMHNMRGSLSTAHNMRRRLDRGDVITGYKTGKAYSTEEIENLIAVKNEEISECAKSLANLLDSNLGSNANN